MKFHDYGKLGCSEHLPSTDREILDKVNKQKMFQTVKFRRDKLGRDKEKLSELKTELRELPRIQLKETFKDKRS